MKTGGSKRVKKEFLRFKKPTLKEDEIRARYAEVKKGKSVSMDPVKISRKQAKVHELPTPYESKNPLTSKLIQKWKRQGMV